MHTLVLVTQVVQVFLRHLDLHRLDLLGVQAQIALHFFSEEVCLARVGRPLLRLLGLGDADQDLVLVVFDQSQRDALVQLNVVVIRLQRLLDRLFALLLGHSELLLEPLPLHV